MRVGTGYKTDNTTQQLLEQTVAPAPSWPPGKQGVVFALDKKFGSVRLCHYLQQNQARYQNAGVFGPMQRSRRCLPKTFLKSDEFKNKVKAMPKHAFFTLQ